MDWGWDDLFGITLVLVLGIGLITFAGTSLRDRATVRKAGIRTEARILKRRFSENATRYLVRYSSEDGSEFKRWVAEPYFVKGRPETAESLIVVYHPDRPKKALIPGALKARRIDVALWGAIGLAALMIAVVVVQAATA